MTDEQKIKIKNSLNNTRLKRKSQSCHIFKIKIQENKLNKQQKLELKMLFVEAKWVYNDVIDWIQNNNIKDYNTSKKTVNVMQKNKQFVTKNLNYISVFQKRGIQDGIITSMKILKTLKDRGYQEPGKLKFKSNYNSIDLKQHGYGKIYNIKSSKQIKIQSISKSISVNGLDQIDLSIYELANAKLLNTPKGYYLAITCFKTKQPKITNGKELGLDFGIENNITTSESKIYNASIKETERLKGLQRKFSRQTKGSNNWRKTQQKLKIEYQNISNRKDDAANKIVAEVLKYETVYMQDEQLSNWHKNKAKGYSKVVQHSIMGRVKAKLINKPNVVVLDRWVATTKTCTNCGKKHDIPTSKRIFDCNCGITEDRDIHAAKNMIYFGHLIKRPSGTDALTPVDAKILLGTNVRLKKSFSRMKQEDLNLV
jgi:putative transposase